MPFGVSSHSMRPAAMDGICPPFRIDYSMPIVRRQPKARGRLGPKKNHEYLTQVLAMIGLGCRNTVLCGGTDDVIQTLPPITDPWPIVSPPRIVAPA